MSGLDLARQAVAIHAKIKVLFMAGYNENVIVHEGVVDRDVALLHKPFTSSELEVALENALAGSSSPVAQNGA